MKFSNLYILIPYSLYSAFIREMTGYRFSSATIISFLCLSVLGVSLSVLAQEEHPLDGRPDDLVPVEQSILPQVFVDEIVLDEQSDNTTVSGTFTASSAEQRYISGIDYEILILDPAPEIDEDLIVDSSALYARERVDASLSFDPLGSRIASFNLSLDQGLPEGEYRLRIQLVATGDREIGWGDIPISLGGAQDAFGVIPGGAVEVDSVDPLTNESGRFWAAYEGVNVDPGADITLKLDMENTGSVPLSGTMQMETRQELVAAGLPPTASSGPDVAIAPSEVQTIDIPFVAPTSPGVYAIDASLVNAEGTRVSTIISYRIVVRGASASIMRLTLDESAATAGEEVVASFAIVGSADRESGFDARVVFDLADEQGTLGQASSDITLSQFTEDGQATILLDRDVQGELVLTATVFDANGNELAKETAVFPAIKPVSSDEQQENVPIYTRPIFMVGAAAVAILLILIIIMMIRKGGTPPGPIAQGTTLVLMLALGLISISLVNDEVTKAAPGVSFRSDTGGRAIISSSFFNVNPYMNIQAGEKVNFEARLSWNSCANPIRDADIDVWKLRNGGSHVSTLSQAAKLSWDRIAAGDYNINTGFTSTPTGHDQYVTFKTSGSCTCSLSVAGSIRFPENPPNDKTTMWASIIGKKYELTTYQDHLRYLTFKPVATPTPPPTAECPIPAGTPSTISYNIYDATNIVARKGNMNWSQNTCYAGFFHNIGGGNVVCDGSNPISADGGKSVTQLCKMQGYNKGRVTSTFSWSSCSDNTLLYWTGSQWRSRNGCDANSPIASFTCSDPIRPTNCAQPPRARISTQAACLNENIEASGTGSSDPDGSIASYQWGVKDPNGSSVSVNSSASSISFPATIEGSYPITLTVKDNQGLASTTTTSATAFNNAPVPNINVTQTVAREPVTLDGAASFDPDAQSCGDTIDSYSWTVTDPSGNPVTLDGADQPTTTFVPEVSGDYTVTLTVTDNKGKTGTKTINVAIDRPEFDPAVFQEIE